MQAVSWEAGTLDIATERENPITRSEAKTPMNPLIPGTNYEGEPTNAEAWDAEMTA